MKCRQVGTAIACTSVTSIVALILVWSVSASAKGATSLEDEKGRGSQSLASSMWQPLPGTSVCTESGIMTVSSRNTFWAGAIAYPTVGCNYRFDADARLRAGGSGYGLAVRASVADSHTLHGQGIQYDQGMRGLRDVLLPDHSESGIVKPATIDSEWHHISVAVAGDRYESSVDGKVVFSGTTPTTCGNGILIRVWRSTADFRNISITPITALPAPRSPGKHPVKSPNDSEILSNNSESH